MSNLIASMTRFSTAMAMFGVEQLKKTVKVVGDGAEMSKTVNELGKTLDSLTDALAHNLGGKKKETLKSVGQVTEQTLKRTLNSLDGVYPRQVLKGTTELVERTRDVTAGWASAVVEK